MQLKEIIADAFSVPSERLCLIYGGKILREPGTITKYRIKDGGIVHMVVKNPRPVCILFTSLLCNIMNKLLFFVRKSIDIGPDLFKYLEIRQFSCLLSHNVVNFTV